MTARRWRALGLIALWIAWIVIRAAGEVNDAVGAVSFLVLVGAVVLTWQWIEGRLKTLVIIALWMSYLAVVMVAFQLEEDITVWSVAAFLLLKVLMLKSLGGGLVIDDRPFKLTTEDIIHCLEFDNIVIFTNLNECYS